MKMLLFMTFIATPSCQCLWTRNYYFRACLGQSPTETPKYLLAFSVPVCTTTWFQHIHYFKCQKASCRYGFNQIICTQVEESVEQSYSYYSGYNGSDRSSDFWGICLPSNGKFPIKHEEQVALTVLHGPIVEEVHQQINLWIYQVMQIIQMPIGLVTLQVGQRLKQGNWSSSKAGRILGPNTDALANALAISQHHDAVCGTEREHVAADYAK
uniref:Glycosyl hydrolase family 38 C-terminal domain-containing protein n=1 Tax=Quercus lobata TaxID=97700 RepID=A0A7N2KY96_QUELO